MVEWIVKDLLHGRTPGAIPAHAPPPHLADAQWRFSCSCGYRWRTPETAGLDAVWRDNGWHPPQRECLSCHTWVDGRPLAL